MKINKREIVYLDNSATTFVRPEVIKEIIKYSCHIYGNPSSIHNIGRQAKIALENFRVKISKLLNSNSEEIFFAGSGTEADNIAILGISSAYKSNNKHIITSKIEHPAVLNSCKYLEKIGYTVTYLNVNKYGIVSSEDLVKNIKDNTILVTIMHTNNEVGSIQPISEISTKLKKINKNRKIKIYFHTDAIQSAGKLKLDVKKLGIDILTISAHKFHGPKGVSAIYVKKGTSISPILYGGSQENKIHPGTENLAYIAGLSKAFKYSNNNLEKYHDYLFYLKNKLKYGILNSIPDVNINTPDTNSINNILNVSFKYLEGESLLLMLDMNDIAVSTGSACASGLNSTSHVLSAMGINPILSRGSIRFSFDYYNTESEIDYVLKILPGLVKNLRLMYPNKS
ncbi:MAG: cysteine desulfurase [Endomicrobium sp.]|jgi:cysteine desulfurase|nr:cysteine desulfurase [Endomicrobium sp.]